MLDGSVWKRLGATRVASWFQLNRERPALAVARAGISCTLHAHTDIARQDTIACFNLSMSFDADVKRAATDFAHNITSRLAEFQRFVPFASDPELTNRFLEAQVRSLIEERLAPKRLLSGIFNVPGARGQTTAPLLIEGAVHDPQRGRPTFEQGSFSVINPATCVGFIQLKPSVSNISKFQTRLGEIAQTYFLGRRPGMVMGILATDGTPEKKSIVHRNGITFPAYQFTHPKWCPIFILFSRRDGRLEPHFPAIEALAANLNRMV